MKQDHKLILVVDDEPLNLTIICEYLESADAGYQWETAEDGATAWMMLEQAPHRYAAILLDRMMPGMDGMDVLSRINSHPVLREVPVIMQTACASKEDIEEGTKAGAYYYLTKPFREEVLVSIVRTAVNDQLRYLNIRRALDSNRFTLGLLKSCRFQYSSLSEAHGLSTLLAQACPDPETAITGLNELMINAVEHGNLRIGYEEKSRLNETGNWEKEVNRRLGLPEMRNRQVEVTFERRDGEIHVHITDQGEGFDWLPYLEISAERGSDNHGRGIALARLISFSRLEYLGKGNRVLAVVSDPASAQTEE
ncbi:MAG: response regulator [gamma proteobacterium endosymbiont of Lamellibrachia anaximandri]|nr:response regulator [gamma proteobacterium endosymbiont of Lamellibrachia anaximandri]